MGVEKSGEIPMCPYWRRYQRCDDRLLVLCGRKSEHESPLTTGEGFRLEVCP